jgi:hypothetical protein
LLADDEVWTDGKAFALLPLKTEESLPLFAVRSIKKTLRFYYLLLGNVG